MVMQAKLLNAAEAQSRCLAAASLFAVLDPSAWQGLDHELSQQELEFALLYPKAPPSGLLPYLPRVVHLPAGHEFIDKIFAGFGRGRGVLAACSPDLALPEFTARQAKLCAMKLPDLRTGWLRYYDPYVLRILLESSPAEQLAHFFAGSVEFYLAEHPQEQAWAFFERKDAEIDAVSPSGLPLQLSPAQLEALSDGHQALFVYELTQFCLNKHFGAVGDEERAIASRQMPTLVEAAQEAGFTSMLHLRKFAELACLHGWNFYERPEYSAALTAAYHTLEDKMLALETVSPNREV